MIFTVKTIAIDPSGNHKSEKEGSGTTGLTIAEHGKVRDLYEIKAEDYPTTMEYWHAMYVIIEQEHPDHVIIEGYKLYNHAGMSAQTQTNSTLMTSQLIGVLKMMCFHYDIPVTIQFASDVKTRWSDAILIHNGLLEEGNKFRGKRTNDHKRDSLRHLAHFYKYKLKKELSV